MTQMIPEEQRSELVLALLTHVDGLNINDALAATLAAHLTVLGDIENLDERRDAAFKAAALIEGRFIYEHTENHRC